MTAVSSHPGDDAPLRAIIFRDGETYVAQCLEVDIAAQASDIETALARLDLTIEAEMEECGGRELRERISPAPNYYHTMWEQRSIKLERVNVPPKAGLRKVEAALARAA